MSKAAFNIEPPKYHQITAKLGMSIHDCEVLLDGEKLKHVTGIYIERDVDSYPVVVLKMHANANIEAELPAGVISYEQEFEDSRLATWNSVLSEARGLANKSKNGSLKAKGFAELAAPMLETLRQIMGETENSTDEKIEGVCFQATVLYWRLYERLEVEMGR